MSAVDLSATRTQISILIDEITATTRELLARGVDPGHAVDKRQALMIVKQIIEKAYQAPPSPQQEKLEL